jgi:tripeptidyl-peptidase I
MPYLSRFSSTNSGLFNRTGHGLPHVAAQSRIVQIVIGCRTELVVGTSCGSPIRASVASFLNDRLIAASMNLLGSPT